jgi:hypothetical protein
VRHRVYFTGQVSTPDAQYWKEFPEDFIPGKALFLVDEHRRKKIEDWSMIWPFIAGMQASITFTIPQTVVEEGQ